MSQTSELDAAKARYRWAMRLVGDHPDHEQADLIRAALKTYAAEKAAINARYPEKK